MVGCDGTASATGGTEGGTEGGTVGTDGVSLCPDGIKGVREEGSSRDDDVCGMWSSKDHKSGPSTLQDGGRGTKRQSGVPVNQIFE